MNPRYCWGQGSTAPRCDRPATHTAERSGFRVCPACKALEDAAAGRDTLRWVEGVFGPGQCDMPTDRREYLSRERGA